MNENCYEVSKQYHHHSIAQQLISQLNLNMKTKKEIQIEKRNIQKH